MSDSADQEARLFDVICGWVFASDELPEEAKVAVLSALEGDQSLFAVLNAAHKPVRSLAQAAAGGTASTRPAAAFLKSITVRGFRGIGPMATLAIRPGPGLTIVAGRNGSGKSSFADALELALTGDTYRWRNKRSKAWSEHWRNVHDGMPCDIRIELAHEGVGVTTVGVDWADGSALADRKIWVQRPKEARESGVSSLGWDRAVELYQPILSYDELGGVLDQGPSKLFDKIDAILGIEQATDAEKRLGTALKQLQEADKDAKIRVRELKKSLANLSDERAVRALGHLRKHSPDLDAVEAIATGTSREPVEELAQLKALTQLTTPSRPTVVAAADTLRKALKAFADVDTAVVEIAGRRARLLRQALSFHEHSGDGPCPVCGQGVLDSAWRAKTEAAVGVDDEIEHHGRVAQQLASAREAARSLIRSVPLPVRPERIELESFSDASATSQSWLNPPEQDEELADHLESVHNELEAALGLLRQEAESALLRHEDEWAPHASSLAAWTGIARKAREAEPEVQVVQAAHNFMKSAVDQLRNQELAKLTALGVMSQGELHALALSLFLPRATMPGSPFRFVVLDDPIQAMDPAKVDGFVRVLAQLAAERQVVVFSHDDRLAQVVRQSQVEAEILEVYRHASSVVEVSRSLDPADRYIDDAFAVALDGKVPASVTARIVPGLCRMAVETAAHAVYCSRRYAAGDQWVDVEALWQETKKTRQRLALAVHGDMLAELDTWRDKKPARGRAFTTVINAPHTGVLPDPVGAVRDVKELIMDLRGVRGVR